MANVYDPETLISSIYSLPEELRDFLSSEETTNALIELQAKYNLSLDSIIEISKTISAFTCKLISAEEVRNIISGFLPAENFQNFIEDFVNKIFMPYAEVLNRNRIDFESLKIRPNSQENIPTPIQTPEPIVISTQKKESTPVQETEREIPSQPTEQIKPETPQVASSTIAPQPPNAELQIEPGYKKPELILAKKYQEEPTKPEITPSKITPPVAAPPSQVTTPTPPSQPPLTNVKKPLPPKIEPKLESKISPQKPKIQPPPPPPKESPRIVLPQKETAISNALSSVSKQEENISPESQAAPRPIKYTVPTPIPEVPKVITPGGAKPPTNPPKPQNEKQIIDLSSMKIYTNNTATTPKSEESNSQSPKINKNILSFKS
jgi:hypothetical protein